MQCSLSQGEAEWESFLQAQPWSPFLQSWTMGGVYRAVGQEPVRLEMRKCENAKIHGEIAGICQAIVVPAKRGKHLSVPYGPVFGAIGNWQLAIGLLVGELKKVALEKGCAFIRMSPFWCLDTTSRVIPSVPSTECEGCIEGETRLVTRHDTMALLQKLGFRPSPLHLLAEHIWYLDLRGKSEEDIRKGMRSTTRNLIGRAQREGVTVEVSSDPVRDLPFFLALHEETRKRHGFTPYTDAFFRAQVAEFSKKGQCALYLARYQGEVIATSIHMIYGAETSYHHGASSFHYPKVPASYLLQWRAIQDALRRGDQIYNFWGIAPAVFSSSESRSDESRGAATSRLDPSGSRSKKTSNHPFAGVTLFKTGFGGELLELTHCMDLPLSKKYWVTFGIETVRKWRRGF